MNRIEKNRGSHIKQPLDFSLLKNADTLYEELDLYGETCVLCGSENGVIAFKNKKICIHCLDYVKSNKIN